MQGSHPEQVAGLGGWCLQHPWVQEDKAHLPLCRMMVWYPKFGCRSLLSGKYPPNPGANGKKGGQHGRQHYANDSLWERMGGMILTHQLHKSNPRVVLLHQELL